MMFSEEQSVMLLRDLPEHGLSRGTVGSVVACYHGAGEYDVTFVPEGQDRIVTLRITAGDLQLFESAEAPPSGKADPFVEKVRDFLADKLRDLFTNVDNYKVKQGVDSMGIDRFINQCALLAATSGAAAGSGGIATAVALPADAINLIVQHIRVTLAVIYDKTGSYNISFAQFLPILGASLGLTAGFLTGGALVGIVATRIAVRLAAGSAGRLVPFLGIFVGGGVNYTYIKTVGKVLQKLKIEM